MTRKKTGCWILTLIARFLMKISVAGCSKDNLKYTLLSDSSVMLKVHPIQLLTNVISAAILMAILYVLDKVMQPVHRGFFCGDHSIMKPYIVNQTVPVWLLGVISSISLLTLVVGTEYFQKNAKENICKEQIGHVYIGNIKLKPWIYRAFRQLGLIFIGVLMLFTLTDIGKKLVGRLRPHFLSVCQPDFSKFNCSDGYIVADVCTTHNTKLLTEARLSFPSGHSSLAAFSSLFVALYIEYAIPSLKNMNLIKPCVQFLSICLGISCGYTRISDYWHHWSDVLGGYLIGTAFAFYTIFCLMKVQCKESNELKRESDVPKDIESQPTNSYDTEIGYAMPP